MGPLKWTMQVWLLANLVLRPRLWVMNETYDSVSRVIEMAQVIPWMWTKLKRAPARKPLDYPCEKETPFYPVMTYLTKRWATNMVSKNEATTLTTRAAVKFRMGLPLKTKRMTLATTAARPLLTTVEQVPEKLLPTVSERFPLL